MAVRLFLEAAVSFRACHSVLKQLRNFLPAFTATPAPNTVESWLLRLGLHELQRPLEKAMDWVWIIDHTMQLGTWKCLLVVGVRASVWETLTEPLTHQDLTLLALEPVPQSNGALVQQQLEKLTERVGVPQAILSDEGSDLTNGAAQFREDHPETLARNDIAHKAAVILKRDLLADPQWEAFGQRCGKTQPCVKQTELGFLAPPTQKIKGRYMNLGPLIHWAERLLRLLDLPVADRPAKLNLSRLNEKFGWLRDFREPLTHWAELQAVKEGVLEYMRVAGYHADAARELRQQLAGVARTLPGQRVAEALIAFVEDQSRDVPAGQSLPASSEVLESLIGKGKRMQGQHSRSGFTKLLLGMAASVVPLSLDGIREALEAVRHHDLLTWIQEKLGPSLAAQRRQALPPIPGTILG